MNPDSSAPSTSDANELPFTVHISSSPEPPNSPTNRTPSRLSPTTSGSMESVADSSSSITPSDFSTKGSTYSEDWPRKEVPISPATSVISNTAPASTTSSQRKPEGRMKIRTLCLLGALLPGIGCYICIFYTYVFQLDRVMNFTSTNCEEVKSPFPPVSYSIGVWKPQKYIWLTVLALHMPARMLYGLAYKSQYTYGQSTFKLMPWFPKIVKLHMRLLVAEALGLIMVSVIDIETIHALCYAIWIICLNFNMLFNAILQHYSGIRQLTKHHDKTFYTKCILFLIVYPLSISTGFSYLIYVCYCNATAYALFSIAEYMIVGINSSFYFTLVWELRGSQLEFHINHGSHIVGELTI
ncbi:hypothetical protein M3Y98_00880200 [Aphelenchoides besseyi]|nr:hypothetical protein M3Y98_00880200 [Aphelenchoides besseyi]KAI6192585.1 hypothetical protein M3Y96_01251500 [Aphelenchoides besseyi]